MSYDDPYALVDRIEDKLNAEHLNRLEFVEIVQDCFDGATDKEKMMYFMADGGVKKVVVEELLVKSTKELKYVH